MSIHGPNVAKLIVEFMAKNAIPSGGSFADGLKFFQDNEYRRQIIEKSEIDALAAIQIICSAPDNPYGDDPEVIAEILLEKLKERKEEIWLRRWERGAPE